MFKKQITAIVLVIAVLVSMVPVGIFAVDEEIGYGTVESISEGITFRNDVQTGAVVDATFAGTLQKTTAPIEDGEAWWVGIKLTAPENYDPEKATYTIGGDTKSFEENKDGENYIELWGKVTPAYMQAACQDDGLSTYRWEFDWDGEGTHKQVIILNIDPYNTVLEEGEQVVYAYTGGQVDAFTEGVTFTNGLQTGPVVEANYKGTLQWIQGNEIRQDGWWVGIKMTAPEFYNAEQATYNGKLFKDSKDGENHIELWGLVTPAYMQAACQDDGLSTYTWEFSWDNNGETIEQTVILNIDPYNTVLEKDSQTEYAYKNGSVESLTHDITYKDDLQTGSVVEATFAGTLQKTTVPNEEGESWRVGIKVTAPEFYNAEQATCNGNLFKDGKTGENDIELWVEVTPEALNAARQDNGLSTYTWKFSWDNNGETIEQTVILNIDAEKTVLMDGALKYYPAGLGNVNCYTGSDVVIDGNATDDVTVTVNKVTLIWSPADESIGRAAGWWVGIGVKAPETLSEEILEGAVYQSKGNPGDEWPTETKSFWTNKDSEAAPHYIQLWFPVNPTTLEKFQNEDRMMTMCYRFDWDGNTEYDQSITFNLNTKSDNKENIKLAMDGTEPEIVFEKAYVDTKGNTKVFFNVTSVHGVSIVEVNGELQAVTDGAYEVTLSGELQTVTVKVTDIYGNVTEETKAVQPKLTVSLTASEAVNTVGKNHYYNENQKLSFAYTTNVDSVDPDYAITEVVLTDANGKTVDLSEDGVWTDVKVTVTDASGRKAEAVLPGNYVYDTTAPKVTVTAENENVTGFYSNGDQVYAILKDPVKVKKGATETVSFKVTVEDTNLNPALYEGWKIEGTKAFKSFKANVAEHNIGTASLDFTAIDLADNKGGDILISLGEGKPTWKLEPENGKYRLDIHVDRNAPGTDDAGAPTIGLYTKDENGDDVAVVNGVCFSKDVDILVALQDNGAGIKSVIYNLEDAGGAVSQIAAVPELKNGRYVVPVEILENTESDRVWLTLTVTDNVGNIFEYHLNFSVDKKAPGIELIEGDVNKGNEIAYYQNGATFLFSVGEMSEYTLEWELDDTVDGNFLELTTDKEYATVTIKDGAVNEVEATLKLTATDVHGHVSKTYEIFFVVDNKAPEVTVTTNAMNYVQTQNGVDYFNQELTYGIEVTDKFMETGAYTLEVVAEYEDETVQVNMTSQNGTMLGAIDTFTGSFTVADGKVLKDIKIHILDAAHNNPDEIKTVVAMADGAFLSFKEDTEGVFACDSNDVVVDMTAPEVTITTNAMNYVQTQNGVDYFNQELTYGIEVTDKFMETGAYTLEVVAEYEDETVQVNMTSQNGTMLGAIDTFTGSFTVADGKVLKDIKIHILDAAHNNPDKIETVVTQDNGVILSFKEDAEGVFACDSNDVVVDMTAPEVTVTTNAMNYVQTVEYENGELVDYFNQELTYGIKVTDKFMEEGTYQLKVLAIYADNTSEEINFKRDGAAGEIGATDTFIGEFTVTDGKILTDIKIDILDAAHHNPDKIETVVTPDNGVILSFKENTENGIFECDSNDVVVDTTAPEVTVTTNAMNYVQTVKQKNGELVDYFNQELTYGIEVTDRFMEKDTYILEVTAVYEGEEDPVEETVDMTASYGEKLGDVDTFTGFFTVTDGKVLTDIKIDILDTAHNNPDEIKTVVAMADGAFLSFKENTENGIFECDSNDVVVDMTAPEVTVTTNAMNYVQTVTQKNGELVDYFSQELTYGIEVTDKFMEEGTYQLEVKAIYEDGTETIDLTKAENATEKLSEADTFTGFFTVTDGKVLTDIKINILDAAHNNPDEVKTVVAMADGAFLSFKENTENGIFECDSNDVCVDTTAPSVEIKFSDNVEKFYQREDGNEKNHYLLVTPVEGAGGNTPSKGTDPVNVTVTVTVKDENIIMADEGVVSDYYIEKLLRNDNETFDVITYQKNDEDTVVYTATVTVEYDEIVKLPFKLNIVDFAGNKPEEKDVTLNSEKQNGLTLENFAQPENGIVGDTVIIDRLRSTSEDRQIPDLTLRPDAAVATLPDGTPLYDANFKVMLDVKDIDHPDNSAAGVNPSAGIQMIEWKIEDVNNVAEMDKETKFNTATLSTQDYFDVVTNGENESNEGKLYVTVTDNAGNKVTKLYSFGLDNLAPRVNVAYDDPAGNTPYFRETRTATITVEDLNFNADTTTVYVKQGQRRDVTWMSAGNNRHVGRVAYAEEGDYEFSLTTTDLATNNTATDKNNVSVPTGKVTFTSEITGDQSFHVFTIDKTAPVISVVYNPAKPVDVDGDGVEYFDENRVAEVTITDTNFTAATTTVTGGEQGWVHPYRGMDNQYSATFGEGNNYVVEAASTDKAGNVAVPYKGTPFSVDLTNPEINITAGTMTNDQLNIVQGDLVLGFTITDTNSNLKNCVVTMQHINGMLEAVTVSGSEYYTERDVSDRTTRYVDITNIAKEKANDGIYSIQITATDYAGRTVNLTPELYMSLNRFGSSFYITDPDTKAFFTGVNGETIYHNEVTKNLIIQEINPNNVWQNAEEKTEEGALITLAFNGNANELEKGVDYSVEHTQNGSGSNTWHLYTYEIFKDNFYSNGELVDGRYKLLFYSEDDAGNKNGNESNVDSQLMSYEDGTTAGMVEFVLDHKKPVVSLIGAEDEETISENNKIVEISISDNAAVAVTAYIDGQAIALTEYTDNMPLDQTWFTYNKETGKYMLNITQSNSRQDIKVVVTDAAGNETVYEVNGVLVTKNIFVQYINSVPALCITAVVLIAALVLVLFLKKRKKEKGAEK